MAFAFNNPSSKLERAVRALLIIQGKATAADCFIANDSRQRILPNRTIQVAAFSPDRPHLPEGWCHLQIVHHFPAAIQPGEDDEARRIEADKYLGDTMDSMMLGDRNSLERLADAITGAGRDLATPNPDLTGAEADADAAIVAKNLDLLNFRCDEIKYASPFLTRGQAETTSGTYWAEMLNFLCRVSTAAN